MKQSNISSKAKQLEMKRIQYIIGLLFIGLGLSAQQQNAFSLQQAIDYALQNNFDIKNAKTDIKIARKKVVETRAIGLPHINASVGYDYFIDIPTQLMPDFTCQLARSKNSKINAHVRVLYKQEKIRKLYRKSIGDYLVKKNEFDRKKIESLLIFETK